MKQWRKIKNGDKGKQPDEQTLKVFNISLNMFVAS